MNKLFKKILYNATRPYAKKYLTGHLGKVVEDDEKITCYVKRSKIKKKDYNYTVEEFDEFYGKISKREDRFLSDRAFMQKIDVDKLLQLIPLLETSQISKLRSVFLGRYGYANINEFFMLEKPYLEQLKQGLEELLKQGAFEDKIKANQIKWFISNLENFILKLNK